MDSSGKKLNLNDKGTRYDHYQELREVFMDGIDVLNRMNQSFVSEHDKIVKVKLLNAVEMITRRMNNLSDFVDKTGLYSSLAREIREAGKHVTPQLSTRLENTDVKPKSINRTSDSEDSGDTTSVG